MNELSVFFVAFAAAIIALIFAVAWTMDSASNCGRSCGSAGMASYTEAKVNDGGAAFRFVPVCTCK